MYFNYITPQEFQRKIEEKCNSENINFQIDYYKIINLDGLVIHCISQIYNCILGGHEANEYNDYTRVYENNNEFCEYLYQTANNFMISGDYYMIFLERDNIMLILEYFKNDNEYKQLINQLIENDNAYELSFNKSNEITEVEI